MNFSALRQKIVFKKSGVILLMSGLISQMVASTMSGSRARDLTAVIGILNVVGVLACIGGLALAVYHLYEYGKDRKKRFEQFMQDNSLSYEADPDFNTVMVSLLGRGNDQDVTKVVSGAYQDLPFSLSVYEYSISLGNSKKTRHAFTNVKVTLVKSFPLMVFDSREAIGHASFNGAIELKPEGDFYKYYSTYVMPGTERDVLHVLTPDFMSELVGVIGDYEIAIENNSVFIMASGDVSDNVYALEGMIAALDVVVKHLRDLSDTWQSSSSSATKQAISATASLARAKA